MHAAPLGLLFTLYQPYVRRVDVDGANIRTLYSGGYPFAVDFDYRYTHQTQHYNVATELTVFMLLLAGTITCFGQMSIMTGFGGRGSMGQTQLC